MQYSRRNFCLGQFICHWFGCLFCLKKGSIWSPVTSWCPFKLECFQYMMLLSRKDLTAGQVLFSHVTLLFVCRPIYCICYLRHCGQFTQRPEMANIPWAVIDSIDQQAVSWFMLGSTIRYTDHWTGKTFIQFLFDFVGPYSCSIQL